MRMSCAEEDQRFGCICEAFDGARYQVEEKKSCLGGGKGGSRNLEIAMYVHPFVVA